MINIIINDKIYHEERGIDIRTFRKKHNIGDNKILYCNSKPLSDDFELDGNINIIRVCERMEGGTITGFPDIGHLLLLYVSSIIIYLILFAVLVIMIQELWRPIKPCPGQIGGAIDIWWVLWFVISLYVSIITVIATLYTYTYWCSNYVVTTIPIIHAAISLLVIGASIILYYYLTRVSTRFQKYINKIIPYSRHIFIALFTVISLGLIINIVLTSVNKIILIYPVGCVIAVGVLGYLLFSRQYSKSMTIAMLVGILALTFGTYATSFVLNSADKCV